MAKKPLTPADELDDVEDGRGRPEFEPTEAQRLRVSVLCEAGVPQLAIANDIGISKNTLRKHFARELLLADVKVKTLIGQTGLRVGLGSPAEYYPQTLPDGSPHPQAGLLRRAEVQPDRSVLIFLMKTRLGLVERYPDGEKLPGGDEAEHEVVGLTESERTSRVAAIVERARARRDRRAAGGTGGVGTVPRKPARGGAKQSG